MIGRDDYIDLAHTAADALIVRPGDTLVVRFDHGAPLSHQMADSIREALLANLPDLAEVIVLNADGLAVYRPDEVTA